MKVRKCTVTDWLHLSGQHVQIGMSGLSCQAQDLSPKYQEFKIKINTKLQHSYLTLNFWYQFPIQESLDLYLYLNSDWIRHPHTHELDIIEGSSGPDRCLDVAWVAVIDNVGVRYVTIVSLMSVTPAPSQGQAQRSISITTDTWDIVHRGNWQVEWDSTENMQNFAMDMFAEN